MHNKTLEGVIARIAAKENCNMWTAMRHEVNNLPHVGRRRYDTAFGNPDLQRIRSDVRIARQPKYTKDDGDCYRLIRRVYRAMLLKARRNHIMETISKTGAAGIFKLARQLNAQ